MERFDVCVIGGGPAGYAAAMRAIDLGKRTVLIEKARIGGTGIYDGALTSKTLWELSQKVSSANEVMSGRDREPFRLSWKEINKTLNEAIFERKYLYACHMHLLQNASHGLFRHERGHARFTGPDSVVVQRGEETQQISARQFIIATGSRPRKLPKVVTDEKMILTSDGIKNLTDLPKSIVIIGAGVIGCEFTTIFSNLGRTEVHLIDRASQILPFEDEDVSSLIAHNFERQGVQIHHGSSLHRLEVKNGMIEYELVDEHGSHEVFHVEKALMSIGRIPNLDQLDLEKAGLFPDPRTGRYAFDGDKTAVSHIYVVGDATGQNMLVNLGELEGRHAVEHFWGETNAPIHYDNVSTIMFLDPEVAGVGLNEMQCREQGIDHRVARIDYACLARAIAMRKTDGFFKLIVSDDDEMRILGLRAVGEHASSAIQAVALMIRCNISINDLADLVHPHPSIIEGIQECARMLLNKSLFKSEVFGDKMRCYTWRAGVQIPMQAA